MKLNTQQIQDLFHFTERHYVEYYDVQVEIVDHLASAIEAKFEANPNQVFEQVLDDVYQSFGPMGLSRFIDSMQEKVYSKRAKNFYKVFWSYFKLPQLLLTTVFIIVLGFVFVNLDLRMIKYSFTFTAIFLTISILIDYYVKKRRIKKSLISWKLPTWISASGIIIQLPNLLLKDESQLRAMPYYKEVMAILTGLLILKCFAEISVLKQVYSNLEKEFPEAFN